VAEVRAWVAGVRARARGSGTAAKWAARDCALLLAWLGAVGCWVGLQVAVVGGWSLAAGLGVYGAAYAAWVPAPMHVFPLRFHATTLDARDLLGAATAATPSLAGAPRYARAAPSTPPTADAPCCPPPPAAANARLGGGRSTSWLQGFISGALAAHALPDDAGTGGCQPCGAPGGGGRSRQDAVGDWPVAVCDVLNTAPSQWTPGVFAASGLSDAGATARRYFPSIFSRRTALAPHPHAIEPGQEFEMEVDLHFATLPGTGAGGPPTAFTVTIDLLSVLPQSLRQPVAAAAGTPPSVGTPPPPPPQAPPPPSAGTPPPPPAPLQQASPPPQQAVDTAPERGNVAAVAVAPDGSSLSTLPVAAGAAGGLASGATALPPPQTQQQQQQPAAAALGDVFEVTAEQPQLTGLTDDGGHHTVLARCAHEVVARPPGWLRVAAAEAWAAGGGGEVMAGEAVPPSAAEYTVSLRCFEGWVESAQHPLRGIRVVVAAPGARLAAATARLYPRMHGAAYAMFHWFWLTAVATVLAIAGGACGCLSLCCVGGRALLLGSMGYGVPLPATWRQPGWGAVHTPEQYARLWPRT